MVSFLDTNGSASSLPGGGGGGGLYHKYFHTLTIHKAILYGMAIGLVAVAGLAAVLQLILEVPCDVDVVMDAIIDFKNPSYQLDPCRHVRYAQLLWLTKEECRCSRAQIVAVVLGGIIGWERRQADRPAGIRTMALVSLGACLFTINSSFAFLQSPMSWDASRVSAAIPSGVGFLGSALIFKEAQKDDFSGESQHVVHGLTTAASVWLSAAVGIACGGELYFSAIYCTAAVLVLLRFGPRMPDPNEDMSVQLPNTIYEATATNSGGHGRKTSNITLPCLSASESSSRRDHDGGGGTDHLGEEANNLITGTKARFLTERPRQRPHFSSMV